MSHRNQLSEAEEELLDILAEEAAEVIQAVQKIKRFGHASISPITEVSNRTQLEEELGDLEHLKQRLIQTGALSAPAIDRFRVLKAAKLEQWLMVCAPLESK